MGQITIVQAIAAPTEDTWRHLADLASHSTWMRDAVRIEFITDQTSGVGTKMQVPTRVGPLRTTDIIEVVSWVPGESIGVEHRGIVSGRGTFRITGGPGQSLVTWTEVLSFPWWWGGAVTAWLARPILQLIWRGNLRRFARKVAGQ